MELSTSIAMIIHDTIKRFWDDECSIAEWKLGTLAPVPKSGNLSDPNKWRPVCLLETTYKILASIIAFRINPIVRDEGMEEQCGSLNSKGCPDALFSLKTALQTRREHGLSTHVLFVDLVKAFDTVNHSFLLLVLKNMECQLS